MQDEPLPALILLSPASLQTHTDTFTRTHTDNTRMYGCMLVRQPFRSPVQDPRAVFTFSLCFSTGQDFPLFCVGPQRRVHFLSPPLRPARAVNWSSRWALFNGSQFHQSGKHSVYGDHPVDTDGCRNPPLGTTKLLPRGCACSGLQIGRWAGASRQRGSHLGLCATTTWHRSWEHGGALSASPCTTVLRKGSFFQEVDHDVEFQASIFQSTGTGTTRSD